MRVLFRKYKDQTLLAAEINLVQYNSIIQELSFSSAGNEEIAIPMRQDNAERIICELYHNGCSDLSMYSAFAKDWHDIPDAQSVRTCHQCGYVIDLSLEDIESDHATCPRCKAEIDLSKPMQKSPKAEATSAALNHVNSPQSSWRKYLSKSHK